MVNTQLKDGIIPAEEVSNHFDLFDTEGQAIYDPRKVEWWLAQDERTILCGPVEDPEIVCRLVDDDPMSIAGRTNLDSYELSKLTAIHIINLHNRGI